VVQGVIDWNEPLPAGAKLSLHLTSPAEQDPVIEIEPLWHFVPASEVGPGQSRFEWVIDALPDLPGDFTLNLGVYTQEILIAHGRIGGVRLQGATRRTIGGALTLEHPQTTLKRA
jgi:hypothetical protein